MSGSLSWCPRTRIPSGRSRVRAPPLPRARFMKSSCCAARGQFGPPDDPALNRPEQFVGLRLAVQLSAPGRGAEDAFAGFVVQVQEDVLGELSVGWPKRANVGAAGGASWRFASRFGWPRR